MWSPPLANSRKREVYELSASGWLVAGRGFESRRSGPAASVEVTVTSRRASPAGMAALVRAARARLAGRAATRAGETDHGGHEHQVEGDLDGHERSGELAGAWTSPKPTVARVDTVK